MNRSWWMKFGLLLLVTISAAVTVVPTALNLNPETTTFFYKQKINLGLDLQGGVYMVLGVDFRKVFGDVIERDADTLNGQLEKKSIACGKGKVDRYGPNNTPSDDPKVLYTCTNAEEKKKFYDLVKESFDNLRITDDKGAAYELGVTKLYKDQIREKTISQSIQVIRNRIDEFGVAEPVITSQGLDKLSVELPGIKDVERAKELIGRTAKLEFKIVDRTKSPGEVAGMIAEAEKANGFSYKDGEKFSEYVAKVNAVLKDKIPQGTEIAFERAQNDETGQMAKIPYLLTSKADVTGEDLKDAFLTVNPENNMPEVSLQFNARGTQKFDEVTAASVGRQLAIVLDGIIHSAPSINQRIPNGSARITLGSRDYNKTMKEAKDLAIVLRAGALPAQLEFLEQRIVGPSLGADSIAKGKYASMVGCLAIFLFMLFYYRLSGFYADISLILNVLLVMAILVGLEATLTLPGIAGIALTVGIAVDSNVVIYERIREELRAGKPVRMAVDTGFDKAFRTILDANVTNAFAALVLMNYGTGPIKGFAVTLMIGIVTTLFTAVFVTKLLFDWHLNRKELKELSI